MNKSFDETLKPAPAHGFNDIGRALRKLKVQNPWLKSNPKRTKKRSKSGANTTCPHCGKKLRGKKGLEMHIEEMHK